MVTFAQATPLKEIKAGYLKISVQQYYPSPLRCFKCQKFGHYKSVCKRTATCALCGQAEHDASPCGGPPKCVNCNGNHSAFDKSCPKWIKEAEIIKVKTTSNVSFPEARKLMEAKNNQPRSGLSFAAAARAASSKSASTQTDASTQTEIVHCTCQSSPHLVNVAVATEPLEASRAMQAEDESVILMDSPEQPRTSKNARRRARKAAERAAKLVEDTAQAECRKELPSIQGSSPTLVPRPVELRNRKDAGGDSARALECLADSPPDLFVYSECRRHGYS